MSDDLKKRLRYGCNLQQSDGEHAADHIEKLEYRLKKAIEIADDLAYANGKWIDPEIDYEEFYSWLEELDQ